MHIAWGLGCKDLGVASAALNVDKSAKELDKDEEYRRIKLAIFMSSSCGTKAVIHSAAGGKSDWAWFGGGTEHFSWTFKHLHEYIVVCSLPTIIKIVAG